MSIILKQGDLIVRRDLDHPIYMVEKKIESKLYLTVITKHSAKFIVSRDIAGEILEEEYAIAYPKTFEVDEEYFYRSKMNRKYQLVKNNKLKDKIVKSNPFYSKWSWGWAKNFIFENTGEEIYIYKPKKERVYDVLNYRHPSSILEDGEKAYSFIIDKNKPKQRPKKNQTIILKR
jgi:hypothetical protein